MLHRRAAWSAIALAATTLAAAPLAHAANAASPPTPAGSAAAKRWFDERAAQRAGREGLRQGAAADRVERAKKALKVALEVVDKAKDGRVPGQDQLFARMAEFIERLDPTQVEAFTSKVKALPPEPETGDPNAVHAWATFADAKRRAFVQPTEKLGQKALDVGVFDIAHDCLQQVLTFDPDSPGLRKALNLTKANGRWNGPRDMEMVKAGLLWDDKLGWTIAKEQERYAKGEYFDLQSRAWTTLEAANAAHATLDRSWVVQTEHLEIHGNAPLGALVDVANRLEKFYEQIFASYSAFFSKGRDDVKLIFGLLDHPRLVVHVAKDVADYRKSLPAGVDAGWSAGMWIPAAGSSFFYAGPHEVIYHEFTHQILHVFTGGNRGPAWAVEGVAVYTQAPTFDKGALRLGDLALNGMVMSYFNREPMTLDQLFALDDGAKWTASKNPQAQYSAAGALAEFCMEAESRRYRGDYIDFIRDSYLGATAGHPLWEYLGLTHDGLVSAFDAWTASVKKR
jgi:hypothetical protein